MIRHPQNRPRRRSNLTSSPTCFLPAPSLVTVHALWSSCSLFVPRLRRCAGYRRGKSYRFSLEITGSWWPSGRTELLIDAGVRSPFVRFMGLYYSISERQQRSCCCVVSYQGWDDRRFLTRWTRGSVILNVGPLPTPKRTSIIIPQSNETTR